MKVTVPVDAAVLFCNVKVLLPVTAPVKLIAPLPLLTVLAPVRVVVPKFKLVLVVVTIPFKVVVLAVLVKPAGKL